MDERQNSQDWEQSMTSMERVRAAFAVAKRRDSMAVVLMLRPGPPVRGKGRVPVEKAAGLIGKEICKPQASTSHVLAVLRYSGLVETRRSGKFIFYRLTAAGVVMADAVSALAEVMGEGVEVGADAVSDAGGEQDEAEVAETIRGVE